MAKARAVKAKAIFMATARTAFAGDTEPQTASTRKVLAKAFPKARVMTKASRMENRALKSNAKAKERTLMNWKMHLPRPTQILN